ncbi:MAG TPA: hypothetical protein VE870_12815, partial [Bacteroidales bacterium]|nr:hypothetical protein [Bacteroidales bacterium]
MRYFRITIASIAVPFLLSCDSTNSSIESSLPGVYHLEISARPADAGTVSPPSDEYLRGSKVEIEARPAQGWIFQGWEGDYTGIRNPDSLLMDSRKTITALFVESAYTLVITVEGEGRVITENIESTSASNAQQVSEVSQNRRHPPMSIIPSSQELLPGKTHPPTGRKTSTARNALLAETHTVKLTAEPAKGWLFNRWEGDLAGTKNPDTLWVDHDKNIKAVFEDIASNFTLKLIQQPQSTTAGLPLSPVSSVEISDAQGKPLPNTAVSV